MQSLIYAEKADRRIKEKQKDGKERVEEQKERRKKGGDSKENNRKNERPGKGIEGRKYRRKIPKRGRSLNFNSTI